MPAKLPIVPTVFCAALALSGHLANGGPLDPDCTAEKALWPCSLAAMGKRWASCGCSGWRRSSERFIDALAYKGVDGQG
jgi:hypothetical protein